LTSNDKSAGLVKVIFPLDPNAWHGSATESVWAEPVKGGRYRLRNVPFYASGVSYDDVIEAVDDAGHLVFTSVFDRGGHSTYRLLVNGPHCDQFEAYWDRLAECGCTYERGHHPLIAVDVPREADIIEVYKRLEQGEADGVWGFEEGYCGHRTGAQ
jgi:hypothetical protein